MFSFESIRCGVMVASMKKYIIAAAAAVVCVCAAVAALCYHRDVTVMEVDGLAVSEEEFRLALDENTSIVYNHFSKEYGVQDSADFWNTEFDGVTPQEYAKELAKANLTDKKCRQKLMLECGIIADAGYSAFRKELKRVNAQRQRTKDNGGVIYGPVRYSEKEYDIYCMSNREIELKRRLEQVQCEEEEIYVWYEKNRQNLYKIPDTIVIDADGQQMEFTPPLARHDATAYPEIYDAAYRLTEGNETDVELPEGESVHIKCISRTDNGYMSFDDAYDSAKEALVSEKYERLVEERKVQAEVKVNSAVYQKIKMR